MKMKSTELVDRRHVTALARGLSVLQCFRFGERWVTHHEITRRTQLPKATVSRLAFTLVQLGFLVHNPLKGEYALSAGGLTLGLKVLSTMEIAQVARPVLDDLAEHSQAAVSLGIRHQFEMVYLAHTRGPARLTLGLDIGARIPLHSTSMGRALICALQPMARERIYISLAKELGRTWPATLSALERSMEQHQQFGFTTSIGEWDSDISAVGAAVDLGNGREPYSVNIGGPISRLTPELLIKDLGPRLVEATRRIRDLAVMGCPVSSS
jgi:DNA-binding IclR family transcriptional regulator